MDIQEILNKHKLWIFGHEDGERAVLTYAALRGVDLRGADLRGADLRNADLRDADLKNIRLGSTDLMSADLRGADLSGADLGGANLIYAVLRGANLSGAALSGANLRNADLTCSNMEDTDLSGTNLYGANLSGAKNLLSPINYLKENFECTDEGYIVYKCFNGTHPAPDRWDIAIGSVIEEEVNPNRTNACGCGINVAPLDWVRKYYTHRQVCKLLIRWEWLSGVVVPYNTDGKIRCARAEIIGEAQE